MFIQTEETPNPNVIKFVLEQEVLPKGSASFKTRQEAGASPISQKLFDIKGVDSVFLGANFISVTKAENKEWFVLKPQILSAILDGLTMGIALWDESKASALNGEEKNKESESDSELVAQIKELIETRVRPAVAQDGGDIIFHDFDEGIVYLEMHGACAGCPSSTATLKVGIENMLRHYVPEVKEVRAVSYE